MAKKKQKNENGLSWKELFSFYTKIRIPWVYIFISLGITMIAKQLVLMQVPYQSKIMTGDITGKGFVVGFIMVTLANSIVEELQDASLDLARLNMEKNVRHTVWGRLLNLPMSHFRGDSQSLVSRVTQDTTGAFAAINVLVQCFSLGYGIYTSFAKMYITYKSLALIMLALVPIIVFCSWAGGKLQYIIVQITNNSISKITNYFAERLPNITYIKTSATEEDEYEKGVVASRDRYKAEVKQEIAFIFQAPLMMVAQYLGEITLLIIATALVRQGVMKMYQMVNLYNYYIVFIGNALLIMGVWEGIMKSKSAGSTIAKLVNAKKENLLTGFNVNEGSEDISFDHVSFSYDGKTKVLDDVSFTIPKGKITAIVGENGCGKSTIIKLLERFEEPGAGQLVVGDRPLKELNLEQWRDKVSYVFQGEQMIKGSIADNIVYGVNREYTKEEFDEATRLAYAYDFIAEKEDGLDTQISRFDSKCSGGEMQRIAIARNILKKPDYLILDEATSAIDAVNAREITANLFNMMKDKTVIMVSHDMDYIKKAEHVIVLSEGKIEASGTFDEAMKVSKTLKSFADDTSKEEDECTN